MSLADSSFETNICQKIVYLDIQNLIINKEAIKREKIDIK